MHVPFVHVPWLHMFPAQHGWPLLPQRRQAFMTQTRPALQVLFSQQGWLPPPPQALQPAPPTHTLFVVWHWVPAA
jgi:hypothetical protein